MINIIVINDKNEEISKNICSLLSQYGSAILVTSKSVADYSLGMPQFLIVCLDDVTDLQTENSFVIYLSDYEKSENSQLFNKNNTALFVENDIKYNYKYAYRTGQGEASDFIISSIDESDISLSINKPVQSLNGKSILPCEYRIFSKQSGIKSVDSVILSAIILILTEKADEQRLEIIF